MADTKNMYKGNAINFAAGYNETGNMPIDIRMVVDKKARLIDKAWWSASGTAGGEANYYAGMPVFVQETGEVYVLKANTTGTHTDGAPYPAMTPWLGTGETGDQYAHWKRADAGAYTLPTASANELGGIKLGYTSSGKYYKVQVDGSGNAYVNVPWEDHNDLPSWEGEA